MQKSSSKNSQRLIPPRAAPLPSQEMYDRAIKNSSMIQIFLLILLLALCGAWWAQREVRSPKYNLVNGTDITALNVGPTPVLSKSKVQEWSARAIRDIFSFGFRNADTHLDSMRPYFNTAAWSSFRASVDKTNLYHSVVTNSLLVEVTPLQDALVGDSYSVLGKTIWPQVEVPVLVSYVGAIGTNTMPSQRLTIVLTLVQADVSDSPDGLQIASMNPTEYKSN